MELKLLNLPTKEIYKDLFSPGMQKAGEALSTVLDSANLVLLPLKLINEKSKIYFEDNIKRYSEKLNAKSLTPTQVPQYVGLPIIDKLTYLEQNQLAEAFLNLLTKASSAETLNLVHPSFVTILNNLSVDEAKILFYYKEHDRIPYIDIYLHRYKEVIPPPPKSDTEKVKSKEELKGLINYTFQDREDTYLRHAWNLSSIQDEVQLVFPNNIDIYIENLVLNGLIYLETQQFNKNDLDRYDVLIEKTYKHIYDNLNRQIPQLIEMTGQKIEIDTRKCCIQFTELGRSFLQACIIE